MQKTLRTVVAVFMMMGLTVCAKSPPEAGVHEITFSNWAGPSIAVRLYVPQQIDANTPIVIVMHGASRDLPRYFDDWSAQADTGGFIVVVPEFTADDFPGSQSYNLGHVFDSETDERRDETSWTFSAIGPLFDHVVAWIGSRQDSYVLYGHSAGSQFAHRFLYYKPDARVSKAILANAGWYAMPDLGIDFPYGLNGSGVESDVLPSFFGRDVTVLLGDADTDTKQDNLRQTPEAELQGEHRLARGRTFFRVAKAKADELGVEFNWNIQIVPDAIHSNAQMTPAAAQLVVQ